jgi:diguanylate cyclase (GGDEF)-like protein
MTKERERVVVAVVTGFDSYQIPVLAGIRRVLRERGISLVAHMNDSASEMIAPTLVCLLNQPSTCAVISTNALSPGQELMLATIVADRRLPIVQIAKDAPDQPSVRADNAQGMTAVMKHVLDDCGARAPVMIRGLTHIADHVMREEIFRTEMTRRGLQVDEGLMLRGGSREEITKQEMRRLLKRRRDMDAVVTTDDWCALAAIDALQEVGLRVPQDVVVTGFDNYPMAAINWPSLTTVDQNLDEQGTTAARMALDGLDGVVSRDQVLTHCDLIVRGSTATGQIKVTESPHTAESIARTVRTHLKMQAGLLQMSRALAKCQTLDDVCDALAECLKAVGVVRSFLVINEGPDERPTDHGVTHQVERLVLDYRDGRAQPVEDSTFSSCGLLPDRLRGELHQGYLGLLRLADNQGELGYVLFEQSAGTVPIAESLRIDLSRTIAAISSSRELAAHSATLERLVAQRTRELESEVASRRQAEAELRVANGELRQSLVVDGLTGIANRAALNRHVEEHWQTYANEHVEVAMLMVDVDVFKSYNDRYGHLLGDSALRTVASCLQRAVRYPRDLACRYGGEEFTAVLPYSSEADALTVATRFRALLAEAAIPHDASSVAPVLTVSVGVASMVPSQETSPETLIAAADSALYRAKREGRNRICLQSATSRHSAA